MDNKTIAQPHRHYGHGSAETVQFIVQRLTGALNVGFLLFLIWLVVRLAGAERAQMAATVGHPVVALVLAALIVSVCVHMRIGMREIITDYVHDPRLNSLSLLLNTGFACAVGLVSVASIAKIVFWG